MNHQVSGKIQHIGGIWSAMALLLFSFTSCEKDGGNEDKDSTSVAMTVHAKVADLTKTVLGEDGKVCWTDGHKLVAFQNDGETIKAVVSSEGVAAEDGGSADFEVAFAATESDMYEYYAVYPETVFGFSAKENVPKALSVCLPPVQHPEAGSFDPSADILVARSKSFESQPEEFELDFVHAVAVVRLQISNLETEAAVRKVSFSVPGKAICGRLAIDWNAGGFVRADDASVGKIELDCSNAEITENISNVWFTCWPFELAAGEKYIVTVETTTETFTKEISVAEDASLSFEAGRISELTVDFEEGTVSGPVVEAEDVVLSAKAEKELILEYKVLNDDSGERPEIRFDGTVVTEAVHASEYGFVEYEVSLNESTESREGWISLSIGGTTKTVSVTQTGLKLTTLAEITEPGMYEVHDLTVLASMHYDAVVTDGTVSVPVILQPELKVGDVVTLRGEMCYDRELLSWLKPTAEKTGTTEVLRPEPEVFGEAEFSGYKEAPCVKYIKTTFDKLSDYGEIANCGGQQVYFFYSEGIPCGVYEVTGYTVGCCEEWSYVVLVDCTKTGEVELVEAADAEVGSGAGEWREYQLEYTVRTGADSQFLEIGVDGNVVTDARLVREGLVSYTVSPNELYEPREGWISLRIGSTAKYVRITQEAASSPETVTTFAEITGPGTYKVENVKVLAMGQSQAVLHDGTAYGYAYRMPSNIKVGDVVTLAGEVEMYNNLLEWKMPTVGKTGTATVDHGTPSVYGESDFDAYLSNPHVEYVSTTINASNGIYTCGNQSIILYASALADGEWRISGYVLGVRASSNSVCLLPLTSEAISGIISVSDIAGLSPFAAEYEHSYSLINLEEPVTAVGDGVVVEKDVTAANGIIRYRTTDNRTADSREGSITLSCRGVSKTVKVAQKSPNGSMPEYPYSIAEAIAECKKTGTTTSTEKYYVKGIVSKIESIETVTYGNATFYISEDGTENTAQLKVFRVYDFNGEKFTDENRFKTGDEVVVCGPLINYQGKTPEINGGCLISINGATE